MLYSFYSNFMFNSYGIANGALWSLFFCHFTHNSLFDYVVKSALVFMICTNQSMFNGNLFVAKTVLLSMLIGSMFLFIHNAVLPNNGQMRPFGGNDAIFQGLLFTLMF